MHVPFPRRLLLLISIVFIFPGCASVKQSIVPNLKIVDIPPLQTEQNAELGDTIVSKGKIYTYRAIDLKNQVHAGDGVLFVKFTVPPQKLTAKLEDGRWTYYVGENVTAYDAVLGTKTVFGGLKISKAAGQKVATEEAGIDSRAQRHPANLKPSMDSNPPDRSCAIFGNSTAVSMRPTPEPVFDYVEVSAFDRPGFSQELIYNGRSGDSVKFLYRELSNALLRAPFTQEVQYDLRQGQTIGFKGVRIEIIDATNTNLKYKVISSLPDSN